MLDGWCRALTAAGFEVAVMGDYDNVLDVFRDFRPDAFFSTSGTNRAVKKAIERRPRMKVVDMRDARPGFDSVLYRPAPPSPAFECDLAFVAHWDPAKAVYYRSVLDDLVDQGVRSIKCFGAGDGCPYSQHLGWIDHDLLPSLYASAKWCLDLTAYGTLTERYCQIVGLGGRCVYNYVARPGESLCHFSVDGLRNLIHVPKVKLAPVDAVLPYEMTYFGRLAEAFRCSGLARLVESLMKASRERCS
jgi:hypothetical protein